MFCFSFCWSRKNMCHDMYFHGCTILFTHRDDKAFPCFLQTQMASSSSPGYFVIKFSFPLRFWMLSVPRLRFCFIISRISLFVLQPFLESPIHWPSAMNFMSIVVKTHWDSNIGYEICVSACYVAMFRIRKVQISHFTNLTSVRSPTIRA